MFDFFLAFARTFPVRSFFLSLKFHDTFCVVVAFCTFEMHMDAEKCVFHKFGQKFDHVDSICFDFYWNMSLHHEMISVLQLFGIWCCQAVNYK